VVGLLLTVLFVALVVVVSLLWSAVGSVAERTTMLFGALRCGGTDVMKTVANNQKLEL